MTLINEDAIHTQFLKCDDIILAALIVQPVDLGLQSFAGLFHLLDGEVFRFFLLRLPDPP